MFLGDPMNRPKNASHRDGFTLIELLVVIAIIGILVAILLPVVSKMRLSANTAATQNQVMQISQAIQNYHNDFQAYPGATADSAYGTNDPNMLDKNLTSTEDLVLALMGGTDIDSSNAFVFNDDVLGKGPVSRSKLNPGQKNAYMDLRAGWLSPVSIMHPKPPLPPAPILRYAKDTGEWLAYVTKDSLVPEFIDLYNDGRPLLYLRANRRAIGGPNGLNKTVSFSSTYDPTACYNFNSVQTYIRPYNATLPADKNDIFGLPIQAANQPLINDYFAQPGITGSSPFTAKGAGSYILISAGQDRRYGTADDIIFYGGGGQ
jgi:prepilin-type N-terminal cleavage/methylation domain-containing protein